MEVDENGNVTKLFGVPSSSQSSVIFQGSTGYNNGVYLLNDICKSRYGNASLGATARSLNIEDIESRMNATGITERNKYSASNTLYGETKKYTGKFAKYPAIYAQEKYSGINVSDVADRTQVITGSADATAQAKMNLNGKSGSDDIYTVLPEPSETIKTDATNLTCTQTGYHIMLYTDDFNFFDMLINRRAYFWLASRYVDFDESYSSASFGLRTIGLRGIGRQ